MTDWRNDWRSDYAEFVAGRLLDQDDQAAFEQSRADDGEPPRWVSDVEQVARWAADRAAVEAQCHIEHVAEVAHANQQRGIAG